MSIKAVLFDIDGALVDSGSICASHSFRPHV